MAGLNLSEGEFNNLVKILRGRAEEFSIEITDAVIGKIRKKITLTDTELDRYDTYTTIPRRVITKENFIDTIRKDPLSFVLSELRKIR